MFFCPGTTGTFQLCMQLFFSTILGGPDTSLASVWIISRPSETKCCILLTMPHCLSYLEKMRLILRRKTKLSHSIWDWLQSLRQGYHPGDQAISSPSPSHTCCSLQNRANGSVPHHARSQPLAMGTGAAQRYCAPSWPGRAEMTGQVESTPRGDNLTKHSSPRPCCMTGWQAAFPISRSLGLPSWIFGVCKSNTMYGGHIQPTSSWTTDPEADTNWIICLP